MWSVFVSYVLISVGGGVAIIYPLNNCVAYVSCKLSPLGESCCSDEDEVGDSLDVYVIHL